MRGEDLSMTISKASETGSPPHARGRPPKPHDPQPPHRITPACAGKTDEGDLEELAAGDHPRMRGEDGDAFVSGADDGGSPPHARGRLSDDGAVVVHERITPACAGKTSSRPPPQPHPQDHPRMRGEDIEEPDGEELKAGSPPHARGRRPHD